MYRSAKSSETSSEATVRLYSWTLVESKAGLRLKGYANDPARVERGKLLLTAPLVGRIGQYLLSQKGCLYRLEAPATNDPEKQASMRATLEQIKPVGDDSSGPGRVLQTIVADQDPKIRALLTELCLAQGLNVHEADSAEQAVDFILQGKGDGAILRIFGNGALGVPVFRMLAAVQWPRKTLFIPLETISNWMEIQNTIESGTPIAYAESRRMSLAIEALLDGRIGLSRDVLVESSPSPLKSIYPLSDRERNIAAMRGAGVSCQDIADQLGLSVNTIYAHTRNIARKTRPLLGGFAAIAANPGNNAAA
ncbi:MAG: LuxR C-terminal-related transcriptional regulator [Verrucomicrobia bacterium]|jgi:DNA-binding NarL/FixJ family response regulator|nr:LuxR C-terminal-related transcriptional regulator [Verrucomicrobiota bacterium]